MWDSLEQRSSHTEVLTAVVSCPFDKAGSYLSFREPSPETRHPVEGERFNAPMW